MANNQAYNNQVALPAQRNIGPVGLSRLPIEIPSQAWLFEDTFDDQPDWESPQDPDWVRFRWLGDDLPEGWDALYDSGDDYPNKPNLEIKPSILDTQGKALRVWREWHTSDTFASNGNMGKLFPNSYDEFFVEIDIAFMPGWTTTDNSASKVIRIFSSTGQSADFWKAFANGEQGPLVFWDYGTSSSGGYRNILAFRGGPHGDNYGMGNEDLEGIGRDISPGSSGDISMNWTGNLDGNLTGGRSPQIPDQINGGFLPKGTYDVVTHEQVLGPMGTFNRIALYVKMNSAPGVADGIFRQYLNGQLIVDCTKVRWVGPTSEPMPGWNAFAVGGNDSWTSNTWDASDQREEFYEIRRVSVANFLPEAFGT